MESGSPPPLDSLKSAFIIKQRSKKQKEFIHLALCFSTFTNIVQRQCYTAPKTNIMWHQKSLDRTTDGRTLCINNLCQAPKKLPKCLRLRRQFSKILLFSTQTFSFQVQSNYFCIIMNYFMTFKKSFMMTFFFLIEALY